VLVSKHDAATLAFIITAILFTALIVAPTMNYAEFYESIEKLNLLVSNVSFTQESNDPPSIAITTTFTIVYPASYSGLKLRSLQISRATVHLDGENRTIRVSGQQYFYSDIPLNPRSNMTVQTIHVEEDNSAALDLAQLKDIQTQLVWNLQCRILVDVFLETPVDLNFDVSYP